MSRLLKWIQEWGIPVTTLVLVAVGVYYAYHTDSMDSRDRARRPQLSLQFANGDTSRIIFGEYPNRLTRMWVHGDLRAFNAGNKPATNVIALVLAPRALGTPLPEMPGVGNPQLRFVLDEQSSNFQAWLQPQSPMVPRVPYNVGSFSFAASPGNYELAYSITCAECDEEAHGRLMLDVAAPLQTPASH